MKLILQNTTPNLIIDVAEVLSICGPSCSGKSTIARAVASEYPTYIESPERNPYLSAISEDSKNFNAMANQMWFLTKIEDFVNGADSSLPMVLDQDPAAIVYVYGRMFRDDLLISEANYDRLTNKLEQVERKMEKWSSPRLFLVLDAPPEVLYARATQRLIPGPTPTIDFFFKLCKYFHEFAHSLQKKLVFSTVNNDPLETIEMARNILKSGARTFRF